jgi:hypothetical protein
MPTRGNAWKSGVRVLARPVSRPCQYGEFALEREQERQVRAHLVERRQRAGRRGHADVDVQRERRLAPRERAHRAVDGLVAVGAGDLHVVPVGERVRARAAGAQPEAVELLGEAPAQVAHLGDGGLHRAVDPGLQLDRRGVGLRAHVAALGLVELGEDVVDLLRQRPVLGVQEHDLLLDAERPVGLVGARPAGPVGLAAHAPSTHVSLPPPPCDELTTSSPSS